MKKDGIFFRGLWLAMVWTSVCQLYAQEPQIKAPHLKDRGNPERSLVICGSDALNPMLESLWHDYCRSQKLGYREPLLRDKKNAEAIEELIAGRVQAIVIEGQLTDKEKSNLDAAYPDKKPEEIPLARFALVFVVHESNRTAGVTVDQVENIFRGQIENWSQIGGSPGIINRMGTKYPSASWWWFVETVLQHNLRAIRELYAPTSTQPGKEAVSGGGAFPTYPTNREVIRRVGTDPKAIGYVLYPINGLPQKVRALAVSARGGNVKQAVAPYLATLFRDEYPLTCNFVCLLSPTATPITKDFMHYVAQDLEANKFFRECGYFPACDKNRLDAERRLNEFKAGKGPVISFSGYSPAGKLVHDLAAEYARAEFVIKPVFTGCSEAICLQKMTGPTSAAPDLLLLSLPLSKNSPALIQQAEANGWQSKLFGGEALAIMVNAKNPLKTIRIEQLNKIWQGGITKWKQVSDKAKDAEIILYGLKSPQDVAALVNGHLAAVERAHPLKISDTPDSLLGTLAGDPNGLAWVRLADLMSDSELEKNGVKLLNIEKDEKAVQPTVDSVTDGSYPLTHRLMLYISPLASEESKRFVQFLSQPTAIEFLRTQGWTTSPTPTSRPTP